MDTSILELQKNFYNLLSIRNKLSRLELALNLFTIIAMWPIVLYTGFDIDVYDKPSSLMLALLVCAIVTTPIVIWHEKSYQKKLINAGLLFDEIKQLEEGEIK